MKQAKKKKKNSKASFNITTVYGKLHKTLIDKHKKVAMTLLLCSSLQ